MQNLNANQATTTTTETKRKRGRPKSTENEDEAREIRRAQLRKAQKRFKEKKKIVLSVPQDLKSINHDDLLYLKNRNDVLEEEVALLRATLMAVMNSSTPPPTTPPTLSYGLSAQLPHSTTHIVNATSAQTILKIIPSLAHAETLIDEICELLLDVGSDCVAQIVSSCGPGSGKPCKVKNRDRIIALKERLVQACLDQGNLEEAQVVGQVVDDLKRDQLVFLERWSQQIGNIDVKSCVQACATDL
ncbi:UNVERIFIED_CONTAM: hypothetical protein HDU68_006569 [Siphonaria sp. JEL0065]|nr:hypothetical protein HDU68_006569 [Siphonaria sp. JEL0065]